VTKERDAERELHGTAVNLARSLSDRAEAAEARISTLTQELAECRKAFQNASDSYSQLRWPDTTGQ